MAMPKLSDYLLENPLYSYGQKAGQQGMQTTPVQSWQEGLARMLQGGLGGLSAAVGMSNAKEEQNLDQKALASAMQLYSTDSAGARAALASRPNLSETAAALMMQDAGLQKQIDFEKAKQKIEREGQREDAAMWGFGPGASSGGGGGGAAPTVGGAATGPGWPGAATPCGACGGGAKPGVAACTNVSGVKPLGIPPFSTEPIAVMMRAASTGFFTTSASGRPGLMPVSSATRWIYAPVAFSFGGAHLAIACATVTPGFCLMYACKLLNIAPAPASGVAKVSKPL